jgi:hypothetical protein
VNDNLIIGRYENTPHRNGGARFQQSGRVGNLFVEFGSRCVFRQRLFLNEQKGDYELKGFDNLVRILFCERRAEL